MKLLKILSAIIMLSSSCFAQQWIHFFADARVTCQAIEGQYLWVGTDNYSSKINTLTGEVVELYRDFTQGSNCISSIAVINREINGSGSLELD